MKNLNKLQLNSDKIMKNEELITLRGGTNCWCFSGDKQSGGICATGVAGSSDDCDAICDANGCASYSWTGY
jgi:natural product precursor